MKTSRQWPAAMTDHLLADALDNKRKKKSRKKNTHKKQKKHTFFSIYPTVFGELRMMVAQIILLKNEIWIFKKNFYI